MVCQGSAYRGSIISQLDSDDDLEPGEKLAPIQVPDGFHLQHSKQAVLDEALVKRHALLQCAMGWITGLIVECTSVRGT